MGVRWKADKQGGGLPLGLTMDVCGANAKGGLCDCFGNKMYPLLEDQSSLV